MHAFLLQQFPDILQGHFGIVYWDDNRRNAIDAENEIKVAKYRLESLGYTIIPKESTIEINHVKSN